MRNRRNLSVKIPVDSGWRVSESGALGDEGALDRLVTLAVFGCDSVDSGILAQSASLERNDRETSEHEAPSLLISFANAFSLQCVTVVSSARVAEIYRASDGEYLGSCGEAEWSGDAWIASTSYDAGLESRGTLDASKFQFLSLPAGAKNKFMIHAVVLEVDHVENSSGAPSGSHSLLLQHQDSVLAHIEVDRRGVLQNQVEIVDMIGRLRLDTSPQIAPGDKATDSYSKAEIDAKFDQLESKLTLFVNSRFDRLQEAIHSKLAILDQNSESMENKRL
ncbi:hypothetical protein BC830DRAFT_1106789 [Chytriomyces sp. MP71]|nr:hypothetical protein BC830DRAFT_1106789 [Chytriomyces sp. MP71]